MYNKPGLVFKVFMIVERPTNQVDRVVRLVNHKIRLIREKKKGFFFSGKDPFLRIYRIPSNTTAPLLFLFCKYLCGHNSCL